MRRPRFTPLQTPATILYITLGVFLVAAVVGIVADGMYIDLSGRLIRGEFIDGRSADSLHSGALGWELIAMFTIAPCFIWWMRRATSNLPALGAAQAPYGPGWAVGGWFVPILNFFRPYQVLAQAWRASEPTLSPDATESWRNRSVSPLLLCWWLAYLVFGTLSGTAADMIGAATTPTELKSAASVALVSDIGMAIAAVLAMGVIFNLSSRQIAANARFDRRAN